MALMQSAAVLLIVRRNAPDLFDTLRQALDDSTTCRVILDRRVRTDAIVGQNRRHERQRWGAGPVLVCVSGTDAMQPYW